jgi:hypothetical protein
VEPEYAIAVTVLLRLRMTKRVWSSLWKVFATTGGSNIRVNGGRGMSRGTSMAQSLCIWKSSKLSGLELEPPESLVCKKNELTVASVVQKLTNGSPVELLMMLSGAGMDDAVGTRSGVACRITTSAGTTPVASRGEALGYLQS